MLPRLGGLPKWAGLITSLPPSAAGPPIGHLGRAGTGRGLEERRSGMGLGVCKSCSAGAQFPASHFPGCGSFPEKLLGFY